jgi:uncharacterized protein YbjT (DUF2867 family)
MYLVTGSTGNVGSEVLRALRDAGAPVRALTRTDTATPAAGVEPAIGDLNRPDTLRAALTGVRGLFLLPGYQDMPGVLGEAERAGVRRVVLLSGRSADGDLDNAVTRYMHASEQAVRGSALAWTILRPSAFMSNALRWLPQLRAGDVVRVPFARVRTAAIDPADIGAVAALALRDGGHGEEHAGQTYLLSGPESLLPADQVAALAEVLGRPLRCEAQPDDEARADMLATMSAEYVEAFFRFYVDGTLDESPVLSTGPELLGRPARTFRQWAEAHRDEFG